MSEIPKKEKGNISTEEKYKEMNPKFIDKSANEFIESILNKDLYKEIKPKSYV